MESPSDDEMDQLPHVIMTCVLDEEVDINDLLDPSNQDPDSILPYVERWINPDGSYAHRHVAQTWYKCIPTRHQARPYHPLGFGTWGYCLWLTSHWWHPSPGELRVLNPSSFPLHPHHRLSLTMTPLGTPKASQDTPPPPPPPPLQLFTSSGEQKHNPSAPDLNAITTRLGFAPMNVIKETLKWTTQYAHNVLTQDPYAPPIWNPVSLLPMSTIAAWTCRYWHCLLWHPCNLQWLYICPTLRRQGNNMCTMLMVWSLTRSLSIPWKMRL